MAQSGWRLPDDLLKRVRVHCAESGERQNEFVRQALESALKVPPFDQLGPSPSPGLVAASSRAAKKTEIALEARDAVRERNRAKKPPAELPRIAPRHWGKS
jgi:hypothetical protein